MKGSRETACWAWPRDGNTLKIDMMQKDELGRY